MPYWTLPTPDELDQLLALALPQRGAQLLAMTPSRRVAYAVAYSKRDGRQPYRILDVFATWEQLYLNELDAAPHTAELLTVIRAVAAGLMEPSAVWRTACALMRCRHHAKPIKVFDGARGGLCEDCITELPRYELPQ